MCGRRDLLGATSLSEPEQPRGHEHERRGMRLRDCRTARLEGSICGAYLPGVGVAGEGAVTTAGAENALSTPPWLRCNSHQR